MGGETLTSMLGYELLDARSTGFPDFLSASLAKIDRLMFRRRRAPGIVIRTWLRRSVEN